MLTSKAGRAIQKEREKVWKQYKMERSVCLGRKARQSRVGK